MKKLSRQDCVEIYYALWTKQLKLESAVAVLTDPKQLAFAARQRARIHMMLDRLKAIIKKIGPDGKTLYASQK